MPITTKLELILAAQSAAAKSVNITEEKPLVEFVKAEFDALQIPETNRQFFNDHFSGSRHQYRVNADEPINPPARKSAVAAAVQFLLLTIGLGIAILLDKAHEAAHSLFLVGMAWPTTGATGNGNAASGQYIANGTATTILWGTNNFVAFTGWLTVLKVNQKVIMAFDENLPTGDGLTAGKVQGIDGAVWEIEVRDDVNQVTTSLTPGQRLLMPDGAGLVPGGARGATYSAIIKDHSWDTAPKTAAGRMLTVEKFLLIT